MDLLANCHSTIQTVLREKSEPKTVSCSLRRREGTEGICEWRGTQWNPSQAAEAKPCG